MHLPVALHTRVEDGRRLPFIVWRFAEPLRVISSAPVGGGLGMRRWVINAQVRPGYARTDLRGHITELARRVGLDAFVDEGVGLLTAADVTASSDACDGGVSVRASVGIGEPVWAAHARPSGGERTIRHDIDVAASTDDEPDPVPPGTINIVAFVPVPVSDAALVNLATTATEAKTQALLDAGVDGSGTRTDAICIAHPLPATSDQRVEPFGGPASIWGARLAQAVHTAVLAGARLSLAVLADEPGTRTSS